MKSMIMTSIFLLFQVAPQTEKASIQGIVVRAGTNEPIPGARVVLTTAPSAGQPGAPPRNALQRAAVTDRQGKFLLEDVDPNSYRLTVNANAFAKFEYGQRVVGGQGTPISLIAGQAMKDLILRMTPAGNVNGRISDETATPAVGVQVQLYRSTFNATGQRSLQSAGFTTTNDRGEYRIFWVTPGRYFLAAGTITGPALPLDAGVAGSNGIRESFGVTYYPGVPEQKDAMILDVPAGSDLSAIDFMVQRQKAYRVRGRVIDSRSGERPSTASLTLSSRSLTGGGFSQNFSQGYDPATGSFEIRDVTPGTYTLVAQIQDQPVVVSPLPQTPRPIAQASFTVVNGDVDNVVLTIISGVPIPARLSVDDMELSAVPNLDRLRVQLNTVDVASTSVGVQQRPLPQSINPDGTFRIDNVFVGEYRVTAAPLPPDFYLKEVRFDQVDALNRLMAFTGKVSAPLEVVISPKAGRIDGKLVNEKQEVVPGVQVILIPDQHRERIELYKTALTSPTGAFTIRGVTPGDYKLFAWETIEQFAYFDPDLVHAFEAKSKAIHVSESDRLTVEVKLISAAGQ